MSHYTTELRYVCEVYAGYTESQGYNDVDKIIAKARPKIFDFSYPIFDEAYRSVLETKIIRHYYTREIGSETVGRWKLFLQSEMNEIMPYYNKLYESELIKFNPMNDVDITTDHTRDNEGASENNTNTNYNDDRWRYYHDTPQDGVEGIKSLRYLTEAERNTTESDTDTNSNAEFTSTEDYLEHIKGKRSGITYSKMLQEYRDTLLNIDMMIINDLNDLFMMLW
jgi:hypothetical protein